MKVIRNDDQSLSLVTQLVLPFLPFLILFRNTFIYWILGFLLAYIAYYCVERFVNDLELYFISRIVNLIVSNILY